MDQRSAWLERAIQRWEQALMRTAYAYLGDFALAEDAVQETFLKAWRARDRFRGEAEEKTWLMRIAINTCKDIRRGAWFRHIDPAASLDRLPEGSVPFTPEEDAITRAVLTLPAKLRAVVILHCFQGLTGDETAKVLGISRSTVFERLQKARAVIQRELEG
ncbi:sigma-70 family RNA polymerase sigma factor [Beduinella massiliensis]|uniref:sigma-70 family RNA polymerase sigma factor n=1 Tax=Beduinella massiliensis TaxID=1852363 RepID=UPI000C85F67F